MDEGEIINKNQLLFQSPHKLAQINSYARAHRVETQNFASLPTHAYIHTHAHDYTTVPSQKHLIRANPCRQWCFSPICRVKFHRNLLRINRLWWKMDTRPHGMSGWTRILIFNSFLIESTWSFIFHHNKLIISANFHSWKREPNFFFSPFYPCLSVFVRVFRVVRVSILLPVFHF